MPTAFTKSPEFRRLMESGSGAIDLARVALEISRDQYPELDTEAYLERIGVFASRVVAGMQGNETIAGRLLRINEVLFDEEGFRGNRREYYDPRNSYLNEVLDRRTGIPISLSILYLAVARQVGLTLEGVNLPSHFMLRTGYGSDTIFVDPFHGGTLLDDEGCESLLTRLSGRPTKLNRALLTPCGPLAIVNRFLRNLKAIYVESDDHLRLHPILDRLVALNPDEAEERRDLGIASFESGRPKQAIEAFEGYLMAEPEAPDATAIGALLSEACRRVRSLH